MSDPYDSMEMFHAGITLEAPQAVPPESLTMDATVRLVKQSNDFAFEEFRREYTGQMASDPMMMPVLIASLAHDWVKRNSKQHYNEEEFQAALFHHRIYENPDVSQHMQQKQMELLRLAAKENPALLSSLASVASEANVNSRVAKGLKVLKKI